MVQSARSVVFQTILQARQQRQQSKQDNQKLADDSIWWNEKMIWKTNLLSTWSLTKSDDWKPRVLMRVDWSNCPVTVMVNDNANVDSSTVRPTCDLLPLKDNAKGYGRSWSMTSLLRKLRPSWPCTMEQLCKRWLVPCPWVPSCWKRCETTSDCRVMPKVELLKHSGERLPPSASKTVIDDNILTEYADVFEGLGCLADP